MATVEKLRKFLESIPNQQAEVMVITKDAERQVITDFYIGANLVLLEAEEK